jgi:hypothetical protein
LGQRGGEKKILDGQGGCSSAKQVERLILNWCIGGCWFTPALLEWGVPKRSTPLALKWFKPLPRCILHIKHFKSFFFVFEKRLSSIKGTFSNSHANLLSFFKLIFGVLKVHSHLVLGTLV